MNNDQYSEHWFQMGTTLVLPGNEDIVFISCVLSIVFISCVLSHGEVFCIYLLTSIEKPHYSITFINTYVFDWTYY